METAGVEPVTSWMSTKHSNHLSYASMRFFRRSSSISYLGVNCNSYFKIFEKNVLRASNTAKIQTEAAVDAADPQW